MRASADVTVGTMHTTQATQSTDTQPARTACKSAPVKCMLSRQLAMASKHDCTSTDNTILQDTRRRMSARSSESGKSATQCTHTIAAAAAATTTRSSRHTSTHRLGGWTGPQWLAGLEQTWRDTAPTARRQAPRRTRRGPGGRSTHRGRRTLRLCTAAGHWRHCTARRSRPPCRRACGRCLRKRGSGPTSTHPL